MLKYIQIVYVMVKISENVHVEIAIILNAITVQYLDRSFRLTHIYHFKCIIILYIFPLSISFPTFFVEFSLV